jgi:hypothetical protein
MNKDQISFNQSYIRTIFPQLRLERFIKRTSARSWVFDKKGLLVKWHIAGDSVNAVLEQLEAKILNEFSDKNNVEIEYFLEQLSGD